MNLIKKSFIIFVSIIILVGFDLFTKQIAKSELRGNPKISYVSDLLTFVYAENNAGMLSLGSELSSLIRFLVFRVFVGFALIGMLVFTISSNNLAQFKLIAFVLIISGGFGNLIERILNDGIVTDFMVMKLFNLQTGIFNVADMFVLTGMFIILVGNIIIRRQNIAIETE